MENENVFNRGVLTEMEFFRMWKFSNQGILKNLYNEGIKQADIMLVDIPSYEEYCANMYQNKNWMIPNVNN